MAVAPAPAGFRAGTPADLQSYRYRVAIRATAGLLETAAAPPGLDLSTFLIHVTMEGERVNPDLERVVSHTDLGYFMIDRETVVMGARAWVREGAGIWREALPLTSPEDFLGQDIALSPSEVYRQDSPEEIERMTAVLNSLPGVPMTMHGRPAIYWLMDTAVAAMVMGDLSGVVHGMLVPDAVRMEVWADVETGVALRVILTAASADDPDALAVQIDMFDINEPSIEVTPPPGMLAP
ncbi:MAG: hypothetical protein O2798_06955 [Chloroflexi bacterium]|nr:hypothetical protein [Chloroflexota bacterium]MDA1240565.1 hypothetical protein [Chloroflexota bacterium]